MVMLAAESFTSYKSRRMIASAMASSRTKTMKAGIAR